MPIFPQDGNDKKYCAKSVRDAFLRELDSYPGDRTAFIEDRHNDIKARAQVRKSLFPACQELRPRLTACRSLWEMVYADGPRSSGKARHHTKVPARRVCYFLFLPGSFHWIPSLINSILERLTALGYKKELDFLDRLDRNWRGGCAVIQPHYILFKDHELVKQCKPLTDRSEQFSLLRNTQTTN